MPQIRDAKVANFVVKQQIFMLWLTHSAANVFIWIRATRAAAVRLRC